MRSASSGMRGVNTNTILAVEAIQNPDLFVGMMQAFLDVYNGRFAD
ncbi:hypothetical protein UG55_108633 [Frankia sp. EI5c]|nr:hypothetical protein UG55_108633 [Frankia sp. EI5c]